GELAMTTNKPSSARELVDRVRDDHGYESSPIDLNSTGGIQREIRSLGHRLDALADYVDGKATGETGPDGAPIRADKEKKNAQARDNQNKTDPNKGTPNKNVPAV